MDSPLTSGNHNNTPKIPKKSRVDSCFVPMCPSTSTKFPNKLFLTGPSDPKLRRKWFQAAKRNDYYSPKTIIRCCEDHFDLPNDMENFMEYHLMGSVSQIRMKPGCIPSKFACQPDRRKRTSDTTERQYIVKKKRKMLIEECEREIEERRQLEYSAKQLELGETSSGSSVLQENIKQDAPMTANKCIQVRMINKFRSKAIQTNII